MDSSRTRRAAGAVDLAGAAHDRPAGAQEPSANRLRLRVAADEDTEMFSFEPGSAPGLEREMIETLAGQHGRRVEVVPVTNFEQIIPMLTAGQGDVILASWTPRPAARVHLTDELKPTRHVWSP